MSKPDLRNLSMKYCTKSLKFLALTFKMFGKPFVVHLKSFKYVQILDATI